MVRVKCDYIFIWPIPLLSYVIDHRGLALSFRLTTFQPNNPTTNPIHFPLQHSRRNLMSSFNAMLTCVFSYLRKAIVPKVRMDRSGNGTYHASLT